MQDEKEGVPTYGSFLEIKFENHIGRLPSVASAEKVGGIDEVFANTPPRDETGLVSMDQERNEGFDPVGNKFGYHLGRAVLQRYGSETIWSSCRLFFGEKDHVGPVEALNVHSQVGEVIEKVEDCMLDVMPEFSVEPRP